MKRQLLKKDWRKIFAFLSVSLFWLSCQNASTMNRVWAADDAAASSQSADETESVDAPQTATEESSIVPYDLTTEAMRSPNGIDVSQPRLSWKSQATQFHTFNLNQTAYQILVASSPELLSQDQGDLWDSGKVSSPQSLFVPYEGTPLQSSQRCYWKVRVWDDRDVPSIWSDQVLGGNVATWIMGILNPGDWKASWIAQPASMRPEIDLSQTSWIDCASAESSDRSTRYFRREFTLELPQEWFDQQDFLALLYYAANQKFVIYVNGQKVGHSIGMVFNPDQLRAIDVSAYLVSGKNVIAFSVDNETELPSLLLAKLEIKALDKSANPATAAPTRRGQPTELVFSLSTDDQWQGSLTQDENWNQVDDRFLEDHADTWAPTRCVCSVDEAPWGRLRRHTETVSPMFQKSFSLTKPLKNATLHITGLGLYEASLDGKKIGDKLLDPSMTKYEKRVLYSTYDLTDELKKSPVSDHVLDVLVGHGWFDVRSIVTWNFDAATWRDFPRMIAQLELNYEDGTTETIVSDDSWTFSTSPILFDCIRQGEIQQGDYAQKILGNAVCVDTPLEILKASAIPATKIRKEFTVKSVRETAPGVYLVDLGQNIGGWCRVKIQNAQKGDIVRFRYSERILEDGSIERHEIDQHFMEGSNASYVGEKGQFQTDFYLCRGEGTETFEPKFSYNGFQYLEVTGLRSKPNCEDFVACVLSTDFEKKGTFSSSNALINAIQAATLSSYYANFVGGYPTDCPQREKNGWTADAHLATEQAMYNWENTAAYEKWIRDLIDEQMADGNLAAIVPTGGWGYAWGNGPAWDSALTIIPWYLYLYRGDIKILETSYDAMKKYVDYMTTRAENHLVSHGLGDWVSYKTATPTVVTSSGYYYIDALIVANTAQLLGKSDDAAHYAALADEIRGAYLQELYMGNGVFSIGSQAAQSTSIHQNLWQPLSVEEKLLAISHLIKAIEKNDGHFDTGILGAKYILRSLSENSRTDLALKLILQEERPAYADWIRRGAGTLWEDWGEGSSRNHVMFGDISAWFYQSLAGIKLDRPQLLAVAAEPCSPDQTAFKHFVVEPKCRLYNLNVPQRETLQWVNAQVDSPYGPIASSWSWNDEKTQLTLSVTVPVNTTAEILVPCSVTQTCTSSTDKATLLTQTDDTITYAVGSGSYQFIVAPKSE